jgi:membrane dipeptidase
MTRTLLAGLERARRAAGRFRIVLGAVALAPVLLLPAPAAGGARPFGVVDLHVDLSYQANYEGRSFAEGTGQFRSADLARAGVMGVVLPLFVPKNASATGPRLDDLERSYQRVYGELATNSAYRLPGCIPRNGRVRTFLAFEGAGPIANNPASLAGWALRGLRVLGLVHTQANALASSSGDPKARPFGLTPAGRDAVRAAASLGMSIDVSHASDRATREVLKLALELGVPVVATHSNARALADHPRNLGDAELRGIAATGGVVGVNFHSGFLKPGGKAELGDVVRQVLHLVKVMGAEHVAIGSDFEGDIRPAAGLGDVTGYQPLAAALVAAGLSDDQVAGIMGNNALRVLCRGGSLD